VASLGLHPNTHQLVLYDPSVDFRLAFNPRIIQVAFYDASATAGARFTDKSMEVNLTDRDTATGTGTTLDSMAVTNDYIYICLAGLASGLQIDMTASVNGTTNTMLGEYYKNDDTWTDLSVTDNTASGGVSLAQDGSVTWTAVTDWQRASLYQVLDTPATPADFADAPTQEGHWMRISFTTAGLDSDTEIAQIWTLNQDSDQSDAGYFRKGVEYNFSIDRKDVGGFEAKLASATDTLQVTHVRTAQ